MTSYASARERFRRSLGRSWIVTGSAPSNSGPGQVPHIGSYRRRSGTWANGDQGSKFSFGPMPRPGGADGGLIRRTPAEVDRRTWSASRRQTGRRATGTSDGGAIGETRRKSAAPRDIPEHWPRAELAPRSMPGRSRRSPTLRRVRPHGRVKNGPEGVDMHLWGTTNSMTLARS